MGTGNARPPLSSLEELECFRVRDHKMFHCSPRLLDYRRYSVRLLRRSAGHSLFIISAMSGRLEAA
jgi:hypothetical protein